MNTTTAILAMKTFNHFSDESELEAYDVEQLSITSKPSGLWLSVEGSFGWEDFENGEYSGKHKFLVGLNTDNLAVIDTKEDALNFTVKYGVRGEFGMNIDWRKVALDYSGLYVSEYAGRTLCHLDKSLFWLYGYDFESLCIWDATVVSSIEKVEDYQKQLVVSDW